MACSKLYDSVAACRLAFNLISCFGRLPRSRQGQHQVYGSRIVSPMRSFPISTAAKTSPLLGPKKPLLELATGFLEQNFRCRNWKRKFRSKKTVSRRSNDFFGPRKPFPQVTTAFPEQKNRCGKLQRFFGSKILVVGSYNRFFGAQKPLSDVETIKMAPFHLRTENLKKRDF